MLRHRLARRGAASLPQIPGIIRSNAEIPDDRLVSRVRRWARTSEALSSGGFDLLQLAEATDGRFEARALCGIVRTKLRLAEGGEEVPAVVTLFYRSLDYLNKEFWEDQVKRLCDIVADEYLTSGRGVQLMVHHKTPSWALGLEVGDHRLLAEFNALHVFRGLGSGRPCSGVVEAVDDSVALEATGHRGFHRLLFGAGAASGTEAKGSKTVGKARCGAYIVRNAAGNAVCGLEVLGAVPMRLVCGNAWAVEGAEQELDALLRQLMASAGRFGCSILADKRDPVWQRFRLRGLGSWSTQRRSGIAVTGVPAGLAPEEQTMLAMAPFLVPWELLPFHAGQFMLL